MSVERWDPAEIESDWLDALAILGEFVPSVDEVAETFRSEAFAASVTNDDSRLEALAAAVPLIALRRLAKEVTDATTAEAGFFQGTIDDRLAESWSWRQNVSWSDEARDALRKAGSTPGEDRTVTIKKDPERLARRGREQL